MTLVTAKKSFFYFLLFSVVFYGREVDAQDTDASKVSEESEEALIHFQQGVELYKSGRYEQASIEFARAYELKPSHRILFNIAQAENMLEHYAAALTAYEQYLKETIDEIDKQRRDLVQAEIDKLIHRVGQFVIQHNLEGGTILINGEERAKTPFNGALNVDIGKHTVTVLIGNEEIFRRVYKIAGGQKISVNLKTNRIYTDETSKLAPEKEPLAETPNLVTSSESTAKVTERSSDNEISTKNGRKVLGIAILSVGGAAAVAAVATGVSALSKKQRVIDGCDGYLCDKDQWSDEFDAVRSLGITTDVLIGVAAVGVVAGTLLTVIKSKRERASSVLLMPALVQNGGALTLCGRF